MELEPASRSRGGQIVVVEDCHGKNAGVVEMSVKKKTNGGIVTGTSALVRAYPSVTVVNRLHLMAIVAIDIFPHTSWMLLSLDYILPTLQFHELELQWMLQ